MALRTLQDLFPRFEAFGDAPALIAIAEDGRREASFLELCERSRAVAAVLIDRGVEPGEPVGLFATNGIEWVVCRLALVHLDAVCVPVDDDADAGRLRRILEDSGARRLFASPRLMTVVDEARSEMDAEPELFLLGPADEGTRSGETVEALRAAPPEEWPRASPQAVVSRFYTSGTTGRPKAVPLSHRNIVTNLRILSDLGLAGPEDRVLLPLPLHHSFPFIVGLLLPLMAGAAVVLPCGLTGPALLKALREGEVSVLVGVPRLYAAMWAGIENRIRNAGVPAALAFRLVFGLSLLLRRRLGLRWGRALLAPVHKRLAPKLRLLASGGAKLDESLAWRLEGLGYQVLTGYGLVETTSVATFNRPDRARLGSAGRPPEGVSVRVAPVSGMDDGEIQVRGPIVFDGYPDDRQSGTDPFTEDGWLRTGDLGRVDEDGYVYVTGRLKEIIVLPGGKNLEPESVEAAYAEHRLVREIAVLERDGQLAALVVPDFDAARESGSADLGSEIRIALGERGRALPGYMRLADFALTRRELPRNHLGKYKRHLLVEMFEDARRGSEAAPAPPSEEDERRLSTERSRRLMDWLNERFPHRHVGLDTALQMELGVDSLAWMDLGLDLERRLGISFAEDDVAGVVTVRDLLDVVEAKDPAEGADRGRPAELRGQPDEDPRRWLEPPGAFGRAVGAVLYGIAWALARAVLRLRVRDGETLPETGPLIVAVNHQSDLDPVVVGAALPYRTMRQVWWGAGRRRVFGNALGRLLARAAHLFPVDERAPAASLDLAAAVLERDRILVWFPESWRSPTGGIQEFRPGVGALVERTGAAVLPCLLTGTLEVLPREARLPRPRPVVCRFGEPLDAEALMRVPQPAAERERHRAIADKVRAAVVALREGDAGRRPCT